MIRRLLGRALDWRFRAVATRVDELNGRLARIEAMLGDRVEPMLRAVFEEEAENRRRLFQARSSEEYRAPFLEADPLVSVTIATRDRADALLDRALPSVLGQSHGNLEVIVVGDAALPELEQRLTQLGDPRVRFVNLTQRTVAHEDPARHWLVGSAIPRNEAARLARGRWLLHFDDDDSLRVDAIDTLLNCARDQIAEVAYGGFEARRPDGSSERTQAFPPTWGRFGWQGALVHAGLSFFERELGAASLPMPGDLFLLERMLRVGVRFAMADRIVWDYHPSARHRPGGPSHDILGISSAFARRIPA